MTPKPSVRGTGSSSVLQARAGRSNYTDRDELFEKVYIGIYCTTDGPNYGEVQYVEVQNTGSADNTPERTTTFAEIISDITKIYDLRNPGG